MRRIAVLAWGGRTVIARLQRYGGRRDVLPVIGLIEQQVEQLALARTGGRRACRQEFALPIEHCILERQALVLLLVQERSLSPKASKSTAVRSVQKRLFSDQDDEEEKNENESSRDGGTSFGAGTTPDSPPEPENAGPSRSLDDIWNIKKKFDDEDDSGITKPDAASTADADDRLGAEIPRERDERPFTPPRVDKEDAGDAFDQMSTEDLRCQKRERDEEISEREKTFGDEDDREPPAWAIT